jgi:hypothetical protein
MSLYTGLFCQEKNVFMKDTYSYIGSGIDNLSLILLDIKGVDISLWVLKTFARCDARSSVLSMSLVGQVRSAFFKGGDIDGYRRIC